MKTTLSPIEEQVVLNIPKDVAEDLERIASYEDTDVEALIYSYIIRGIADDSLVARRVEFTDKANEVLEKQHMPNKSVEDIHDLVY